MAKRMLNLACGGTYITGYSWVNVDFKSNDDGVIGMNLLDPTPFESCSFDVVYSSHFFEHVPRHLIPRLLAECLRILQPGGVLRLVVPDCEEMFSEYLRQRKSGDHLLADFVIAEIVDQCVRVYPGGRLGKFYEFAASANFSESFRLAAYIKARNGETLSYFHSAGPVPCVKPSQGKLKRALSRLKRKLLHVLMIFASHARLRVIRWLYGQAFVEQNVSFSNIGERHHWLWDFYQIQHVLHEAGFANVTKCSHQTGVIPDFPFYPLDMTEDGSPRKGLESMYVEAIKPFD